MKTVFSNHSELCHVFASRSQSEGRGTNMSFHDGTLYSYGTAIMRFMTDNRGHEFLLVNNSGYSNSTCKHMIHARRATHHIQPQFDIDGLGRGVSLNYTMKELGPKLYNCALDSAAQAQQKSIKARTYKSMHLERAQQMLVEARRISDFFGLKKKPDGKAIERLIKEKEKAAKEHAKEMRESEQRRQERERQLIAEVSVELEKWIRGEECSKYMFHKCPVVCRPRAKKTLIETSNGAVIPYEAGRNVFEMFRTQKILFGEDGLSVPVGQFHINEISQDHVRIGCTTILKDEIERFAKQEGWL